MISSKQVAKTLFDALKRGVDSTELANLLSERLLKSSQETQIKHILFYLKEYERKDKEENLFQVESATAMSPSDLLKLQQIFGVREDLTKTSTNTNLIGGFRLRYGDISYDTTLKTRLRKLKEALN